MLLLFFFVSIFFQIYNFKDIIYPFAIGLEGRDECYVGWLRRELYAIWYDMIWYDMGRNWQLRRGLWERDWNENNNKNVEVECAVCLAVRWFADLQQQQTIFTKFHHLLSSIYNFISYTILLKR